jgi:hypothetical protein
MIGVSNGGTCALPLKPVGELFPRMFTKAVLRTDFLAGAMLLDQVVLVVRPPRSPRVPGGTIFLNVMLEVSVATIIPSVIVDGNTSPRVHRRASTVTNGNSFGTPIFYCLGIGDSLTGL